MRAALKIFSKNLDPTDAADEKSQRGGSNCWTEMERMKASLYCLSRSFSPMDAVDESPQHGERRIDRQLGEMY